MSFIRFFSLWIIFTVVLYASVGKVSLVKGDAFVLRSSQTLPLQTGSKVDEKDTVSTGKNGQIQITFEDKTVITLGNSSTFKIEEYLNQEQKPKAKFSFAQGTFKTITGKIGKRAPENFTLETKTATIGIRGTIIRGKLGDRSDKIMCEKGAIGVRSHVTGREVLVPMGRVVVLPHDAPPLPVRDVQPSDLAELSLNGDPTPPDAAPANGSNPSDNPPSDNPPAGNPPADNPPSGGGQAPLSADNFQPSNDAPPPPAPLLTPLLQNFTPDVANNALETSFDTIQQDTVVEEILTQECPSGTTGTYPDCVALTCPSGTTGTYPDCVALTCPSGTTGTYPDCVALTCPSGTTGTYPDCVALTCPSGTTGTYPDCVALTCPSGTTGTYPDCVALTCPSGTTGTYPDCVALTCPSGTTGTYPDCTAIYVPPQQCPAGYTGTYPDCIAPISFSLKGLSTSSRYTEVSTPQYGYDELSITVDNSNATGYLTLLSGSTLDLNLSTVSGTTAQTFALSDFNTSGTWLGTTSSSPDSTISWGKWSSVELDNNQTLMPGTNNFWVAGSDLTGGADYIANVIATQTTSYTYTGKVFGSVYDQATYYPIDPSTDLSNEVRLKFNFGNGNGYLSGNDNYIRFTVNGLYWYMPVASEVEILNGTFSGYFTDMADGQMSGFFNGATADSIGGAFHATYTDQNTYLESYAFGVFAGTKQTCPAGSSGTYPNCIPFTLSGMATSSHNDLNGTLFYSGNDTLSIMVDSNISFSSSLSLGSDQNEFNTSLSGVISVSSFNDFNATQIWSDSTLPNDYVAWGYWSSPEVDGNQTLVASENNYWIAGKDAAAAAEHIDKLIDNLFTTTYTYYGQVIGHINDGTNIYAIDTITDNSAQLEFNFGGGTGSLLEGSYIQFQTTESTPEVWTLSPNIAAVSSGKFSTTLTGNGLSTGSPTGTIAGQFFGNSAQAVGGTFKADAISKQAIGVFKAVR